MLIRVDDYPYPGHGNLDAVPKDIRGIWSRFMDQLDLPLCLGVTSGVACAEDLDWLRSDSRIELAGHGLYHIHSEFSDTTAHDKMLRCRSLFGTEWPRIYIPPFHETTRAMCQAISDVGFRLFPSHDVFPFDPGVFDFAFMPFRRDLYGVSTEILTADLSAAPQDILTLHIQWEQPLLDSGNLRKLRERIKDGVLPWDRVQVPAAVHREAAAEISPLTCAFLQWVKFRLPMENKTVAIFSDQANQMAATVRHEVATGRVISLPTTYVPPGKPIGSNGPKVPLTPEYVWPHEKLPKSDISIANVEPPNIQKTLQMARRSLGPQGVVAVLSPCPLSSLLTWAPRGGFRVTAADFLAGKDRPFWVSPKNSTHTCVLLQKDG